jgi:hypothetical protein
LVIPPAKDIGLLSFKDGSNLLFKYQNGKVLKTTNLKFMKICAPNSELYTALDRIGFIITNMK